MKTERLNAFSDGVIAILITIMVLEMKAPHKAEIAALLPILPIFLSYVMSFLYLGIYWNNHHHLLYAVKKSTAGVLWANLHLLFWLSLIPFTTAWMGENKFAALPTMLYGCVLLASAIAYFILQSVILKLEGPNSNLARELGKDIKGKISLAAYLVAIPSALVSPWIANAIFLGIALMWLIPDRRIERALGDHH